MDIEELKSNCLATVLKVSEKHIKSLFDIWLTVGHANLHARKDVICNNVEMLFKDMVAEEQEFQNNLVAELEDLLKEASDLCKQLGGEFKAVTSGVDENTPLMLTKQILDDRLKEFRARKQEVLERYEKLRSMEQDLCESLHLQKRPEINGVPTVAELDEFAAYIDAKIEEQKMLKLQYEETKRKIDSITSELGISPDTSVHKMLANNSSYCVSNQNMILLKGLHQDLEQRLEHAKTVSMEFREKLSNLWERLHIDYEERNAFLVEYPGHSKRSIEALKAEIQRCEELKRQNIRVFVEAIRKELVYWWDKCCYGKLQRATFSAYFSDCYTEDLLDLHEIEIEKLKKYFLNNRNILDLAKEHQKLWKKKIELDERAHDPKRLFGNRGGQLLKEEKERKAIQKDLPVREKELIQLLDSYESQHHEPFVYDGTDLREIIKTKWESFEKKKEREKLARRKDKDLTADQKPLSATKRKMPCFNTPASVPSKMTKTGSHVKAPATTSTGRTVVCRIMDRKGNVENGVNTRPRIPRSNQDIHSPDGSYLDFQTGLEKRSAEQEMVRSSVVPSHLLKERNRPNNLKSIAERVATPAKPPRKNSFTRSCTNLAELHTPQAVHSNSPRLSRTRSAPRLTTARVFSYGEGVVEQEESME